MAARSGGARQRSASLSCTVDRRPDPSPIDVARRAPFAHRRRMVHATDRPVSELPCVEEQVIAGLHAGSADAVDGREWSNAGGRRLHGASVVVTAPCLKPVTDMENERSPRLPRTQTVPARWLASRSRCSTECGAAAARRRERLRSKARNLPKAAVFRRPSIDGSVRGRRSETDASDPASEHHGGRNRGT